MNANEREWFDGTVRCVVGAAFEVSNCLGSGFLEKVYERALMIELQDQGLKVASQVKLPVKYKGKSVGNYVADLLVQDRILIELKCTESLYGAMY